MLDRAAILRPRPFQLEAVEIPEWGGTVHVRQMSSADRDAFEADCVDGAKLANFRARLAIRTVCDANGTLLFCESDAKALGEQPAAALQRVFNVAQRLNAFSADDVRELEKN